MQTTTVERIVSELLYLRARAVVGTLSYKAITEAQNKEYPKSILYIGIIIVLYAFEKYFSKEFNQSLNR